MISCQESDYEDYTVKVVLSVLERYPTFYFSVPNILWNIYKLELTTEDIHYNQVKWILQKLHSKNVLTRKRISRRYVYKINDSL